MLILRTLMNGYFKFFFILFLLLFTFSCVTMPHLFQSKESEKVLADFHAGRVELTCSNYECIKTFEKYARKYLRKLPDHFDKASWEKLAENFISTNMKLDFSYSILATAAQKCNNFEAALIYNKKCLSLMTGPNKKFKIRTYYKNFTAIDENFVRNNISYLENRLRAKDEDSVKPLPPPPTLPPDIIAL